MIIEPMDVLKHYEVRKSKKQKTAFITAVTAYAASKHYSCCVEKGSLGSRNIIIGDPTKAKYLVTAHYDTCAWMPVPNFITPCNILVYLLYQVLITCGILFFAFVLGWGIAQMIGENTFLPLSMVLLYAILLLMIVGPANPHTANDNTSGVVAVLDIAVSLPLYMKEHVAFVLFDLEEAGLIGSASYRAKHKKQTQNQVILNLDCVGDGDEILFFPTPNLRKDQIACKNLHFLAGRWGRKSIKIKEKGFAFYPSDQVNFPKGVGIAAFHSVKHIGPYCSNIHTHKDTMLDPTNINILRAALISLIGTAVK